MRAAERVCRRLLPAVVVGLLCCSGGLGQVTGEEVRRAVRDGVRVVKAAQNADGTWPEHHRAGGETCLATLALLQAGEPVDSPSIRAALQRIRRLPDRHTYVVSLKIMVLTQVGPEEYQQEIRAAARWLVDAQNRSGLWNYTELGDRFDHSNSQFALLGLHAAGQAGVEIPRDVWSKAHQKVVNTQNDDGGWTYQARGASYGSMTAAGVADLFILGNELHQTRNRKFRPGVEPCCDKARVNRSVERGLRWLGRNFRPGVNPPHGSDYVYYWLYSVERCGILSGQRYFGEHDWYREGAAYLVRRQRANGSWNENLVDTCFALLFLAKGHRSLLIQKLRWSEDDDAWSPNRNDAAHLVAYIGDKLGGPVAWQEVSFDAPLEDWLAAPLLYFQGDHFPEWDANQRAKLRAYVEQGGTILAEATCGRDAFRAGFEQFVRETFPESPLRELGPDHPLYRLEYPIEPYPAEGSQPYALMGIDFACRVGVIFSPRDISCAWEVATVPAFSERAFRLGTNIAAYAVGRRPLRDRLDSIVLPRVNQAAPGLPGQDAFRLAQIVYEGDWRPFPLALVHLAEFLRQELAFDVVTQYRQLRLTDEDLYQNPVLFLAGHYPFELSVAERDALAGHLRRGGFLVADACCGGDAFDRSFRALIKQVFPDRTLERLPLDHPIYAGEPGFEITAVRFSPDVERERPGLRTPELWGLRLEGRLVTVYSPYSLSCGLSGPAFEGCWGLASEDARRLAANIVLYALTR